MGSLVSDLRERIQDTRPAVKSFTLAVTSRVSGARALLRTGFLSVIVEGGSGIQSIKWDLSDPSLNTAGRLLSALNAAPGYQATPGELFNPDVPSEELSAGGAYVEIGRVGSSAATAGGTPTTWGSPAALQVSHRLFSDAALQRILEVAAREHNPHYTLAIVPPAEQGLVLTRAEAAVFRELAAWAARAKQLEMDAGVLLSQAQDRDRKYLTDVNGRLARTLPSAKADDNRLGTGDVTQGVILRAGLRSYGSVPYGSSLPANPPLLFEPADDDVEDTRVRVRWERSTEARFAFYELWRDTQANVERASPAEEGLAASSSVCVFGVRAAGGGPSFGTSADAFSATGRLASFVDEGPGASAPPLEPETEYYYRLFAFNRNGEATPSRVIRVRTKAVRAKLRRLADRSLDMSAVTPRTGPLAGGTSLTLLGTGFAQGVEVTLNGKTCAITLLEGTRIQCVTPGFTNTELVDKPLDLVIASPNGLREIVKGIWRYTT